MSRILLSFALFLLLLPATQAADWSGQLYGGGEVRVDPDTNRATLYRYGRATPLWDGSHRMQDGSVLIIRSGSVVPNQGMMEQRHGLPRPQVPAWEGRPIVGYSPCEQLVRRVCGEHDQCSDNQACSPARQLLGMEVEERQAASSPNHMTFTSSQCQSALEDREFFADCATP